MVAGWISNQSQAPYMQEVASDIVCWMEASDEYLNVEDSMLVILLQCVEFLVEPECPLWIPNNPDEVDLLYPK